MQHVEMNRETILDTLKRRRGTVITREIVEALGGEPGDGNTMARASNYLRRMAQDGLVRNVGDSNRARWRLVKTRERHVPIAEPEGYEESEVALADRNVEQALHFLFGVGASQIVKRTSEAVLLPNATLIELARRLGYRDLH